MLSKRKYFEISLKMMNTTFAAFAQENGFTASAVSNVLDGKLTSERISAAVDRFNDLAIGMLRKAISKQSSHIKTK
jgi:hypothetical protein